MEDLSKLLKVINTDKIVTEDELTDVLIAVTGILAKFKKETENLNEGTLEIINAAQGQFQALQEQIGADAESAKQDFNSIREEVLRIASTLRDGVDGEQGPMGPPGKNADEDLIVDKVLSQIKLPEFKETMVTGEDIVDKINELSVIPENQIDFSHIKNAPKYIQGGHSPTVLTNAVDLDNTDRTDGYAVVWDATNGRFKFAASGGGGSGSGDVVGPSSATDNALARFDGTTGKLIQNSVGTLDDSGNLNVVSGIISGTNGSGHINLRHQASDATATGQTTSIFADSNGDFKWKNAGNYYTTLKTSSNTTNRVYTFPDADATLFALPTLTSGSVLFSNGTTIAQKNARLFWDDTNNRLGVGTNSPTAFVDIVQTSTIPGLSVSGTGFNPHMRVTDGTVTVKMQILSIVGLIGTETNHASAWYTNNTERVRVTATGDVGIRTTSPGALLHILGGGTAATGYSSQTMGIFQNTTNTTTNSRLSIISGNAGEAIIDFGDTDNLSSGAIVYNHSSDYINFLTSGTEKMRITSAGFVGVGTSSPVARLNIAGNLSSTSWTTAGRGLAIDSISMTDISGSGTISTRAGHSILSPVFASSSSVTVSDATTLYLDTPVASTNTTITRNHSLITTGNIKIGGLLAIGGTNIDPDSGVISAQNVTDPTAGKNGANFARTLVLTASNSQPITGGTFNTATSSNNFAYTGVLRGSYSQVQNSNLNTVADARGADGLVYNVGAGTITTAAAINGAIQNLNATGVITNAYGINVSVAFNFGTINNTYGVYVGDVTNGTQTNQAYGLYVSDANARNYIAGNLGVGALNPSVPLEVNKAGGSLVGIASFFSPGMTDGQRNYIAIGKSITGSEGFSIIYNHNGGTATSRYLAIQDTNSLPGSASLVIQSPGRVGIGLVSPTASLHIKAGTATANTAPLKFTSGINLTTAETGAMEYDGTNLYFTPTGTTRQTLTYLGLAQTWTATQTFTAPRIITELDDTNGNEVFKITATTSAVNEITIANAATGNAPSVTTSGDDTNIDLNIGAKGTGQVKVTSSTFQDIVTATDGATVTFAMQSGNYQRVTLGGNRTLALSNVKVGQFFVLDLVQDGTGSRTVTWFTTIKWAGGSAPTLTTTAGKIDSFGFVCTSSGNYQGYILGQNL